MSSVDFKAGFTAAIGLTLTVASPTLAQDTQTAHADDPIVVTPPVTEGERRKELRQFTRQIVRRPKRDRQIARFRFPICVQVKGVPPEDARAIEERIRQNAEGMASGADRDPDCTPTVRVAFMAPKAGPAKTWLSTKSQQLAHLPIYQRRRVLEEKAPVRAWSKVVLRDKFGQPIPLVEEYGRVQDSPIFVDQFGASDPIYVSETTGAAVLIEREAAEGFTLAQLADYITMRALIATSPPDANAPPAAPTILSLFQSSHPPVRLTSYDEALLEGVYKAPRNSTPRRMINNTASIATREEQRELSRRND